MITPKFVPIVSITGILSLVAVGLLTWWITVVGATEQQRDCERAVAYRNDGRAMWLYLVDTNSGADQARVDAFVAELNHRLPPLKCVDGNAVPDRP